MKTDRRVCVAIAATWVQLACAARPASPVASAPAERRFQAAGTLVLADSNEVKAADTRRFPSYPAEMRSNGVEAGFVSVFVLDTSGRVEYPTITFSTDAAPPFRAVVCSYLFRMRFTPVIRDGAPRRALVITPWIFGLEGGRWEKRQYDVEPLRRAVAAEGLASAVTRLEAQAHC